MTSRQHQAWINEGGVWHPAVPILELEQAIYQMLGAPAGSVQVIGNDLHLDAEPPEDHTPYSETGWPVTTPHLIVTALDYAGPGWEALFDHLINERMAGRFLWIKYINFKGLHHRWEPNYQGSTSTDDKGHGHLSIASNWCFISTGLTPAQLVGAAGDPTPTPTPAPTTVKDTIMSDWTTLAPGSTGQQVRDAQGLLNANGAGLNLDGLYGPKTTAAAQLFQVTHNVANSVRADGTGDGQIGPRTLLALLGL